MNVVAVRPLNVLALCAGVGGLELGLKLAVPTASPVCYVEREAYAVACLVARMGELGQAPVWSDLTTFDGRPWRGRVDCVTSGLPCQPYSTAGKRQANSDARALWPEFVRVVDECEPGLVFIENVPPFLKHFEPARRQLQRLGFEFAAPLRASAAAVGAPHLRRRVFILAAHPKRMRVRQQPWRSSGPSRQGAPLTLEPIADLWAEPGMPVSGSDDALPDRLDRMRAVGNGVVPIVAAAAFRVLGARLGLTGSPGVC